VSAASVRGHVGQDFAKLVRIDLSLVDKKHPRIRIAHYGRERLIQFVGEGCSHFAKQTDTTENIDLLPGPARFLFRALPQFLGLFSLRHVH